MRITTAFAMLAVLGAVLIAPVAAKADGAVRANIPFEFVVGSQTLPAGTYQFGLDHYGTLLRIWNLDHGTASGVLVNPAYLSSPANEGARVVFNKYGDRYFLSEVWSTRDVPGRRVPKSRQEREASLKAQAQPIMVAAR